MNSEIKMEFELEKDGRWIAEAIDFPGVLAYGSTKEEARIKAEVLALRVVADRIEADKSAPDQVRFAVA